MPTETGYFNSSLGCRLYYKIWLPEGTPKAVIVLLHGVADHVERYKNVYNQLVPSGYALAAYDQYGHGMSEGRRGHVDHWENYHADLKSFLEIVGEAFPRIPVYLYGHSMGSLVVLDYQMREQPQGIHGLILSGTPLEPADAAPPVQVFLAKVLSGIYPTFSMKVNLPGSSLTRITNESDAYNLDPLVFWQRSARWGSETLKTVAWINDHPERISLPLLFVHGENDPLVLVSGVRNFYNQISYPDKTIQVYPGSLHEPHNDLDFEKVIADIGRWIAAHL